MTLVLSKCDLHDQQPVMAYKQGFYCESCQQEKEEKVSLSLVKEALKLNAGTCLEIKKVLEVQIKQIFEVKKRKLMSEIQIEEQRVISSFWWPSLFYKIREKGIGFDCYNRLKAEKELDPKDSFQTLQLIGQRYSDYDQIKKLYSITNTILKNQDLNQQCQKNLKQVKLTLVKVLQTRSSQFKKLLMERVELHMSMGHFSESEANLNQILFFDQNDLVALNKKAKCLNKGGRFEKAEELYKSILQKNQKFPMINFNMGNNYLKMGKLEEGIAFLQKQLNLTPLHYKTLISLALHHYKHHNYSLAVQYAQQASTINPIEGEVWQLLCRCYRQLGQVCKFAVVQERSKTFREK